MDVSPPPPQSDDPIITQFKPVYGQWELNDDNINRIDPTTGNTILHNYCRHVNTTPIELYRFLIEVKGCDVNLQDDNRNTPLYYALCCFDQNKGGDITVLMYLLNQKGVDPNIKDNYGCTLLHYACQCINKLPVDVFKFLIETHGFDVNAQDNHNNTPLHNALHYFNPNDDITALTYLFSQEGVKGNIKDLHGSTILHYACQNINKLPIDVFKLLIETVGYDVNAQNNNKNTPLYYALCDFDPNGGNITVLLYLLTQTNINVNVKGYYGQTLLHYACDNINTLPLDVFKLLIEKHGSDVNAQNDDKDTPLHRAITSFRSTEDGGNITVLTYLLSQKGLSVNIKGQYDHTLLHAVCANINTLPIDVFKLFIGIKGCDVNLQNNNRNTPLYYALFYFDQNKGGDIAALTYLFSQEGVNGNLKDLHGCTLLHTACKKIHHLTLEIFKLLIEKHGGDVNAQNNYKNTPLHYALRYFNPNDDITVLTYLLSQKGIDVNTKHEHGETLLHMVCEHINTLPIDVFKLLIETLGYDVNAQDDNNDTPVHQGLCCFNPNSGCDINVFAYLINQTNINLNIKYTKGFTLLHSACIVNLSNTRYSAKLNAECDTALSQIVEIIAERCVQELFEEKETSLEAATTTM
jgi:ankyrin repeat protein